MLTAGLGGRMTHGCVALDDGHELVGVCEQERVTRVRGAGFNPSGLPDEALDTLLGRLGRSRLDIDRFVWAEPDRARGETIDPHLAHASTAYRMSAFDSAAIVVCDHTSPKVSVWTGDNGSLSRVDWPWQGPGFADVYSQCARAFGFGLQGGDQRFEALARQWPDSRDTAVDALLSGTEQELFVAADLEQTIETRLAGEPARGTRVSAALASALGSRIAELFVDFLHAVRRRTGRSNVCLGGNFFSQSSINSAVKKAGLFDGVFIPVDPGTGGLAVGAALHAQGRAPRAVSPFLGPAYTPEETKETLDNCKLRYSWESEDDVIAIAVGALQKGTLVGWFDGAMEWGPRALGGRSILANPLSPFVLENLNRFLKRREPWRGYALSVLERSVTRFFDGPATAPYMECDYRPLDPTLMKHALPRPGAAIRAHTAGAGVPPRFRRLLEAFDAATGVPFVLNTSFNGFHEPIVCSPRDAVRVFYGSGLDVLILDRFVLRK